MMELARALAEWLGSPVTGLHRLSGGASRETWAFESGGKPLVLRREPHGAATHGRIELEARAIRAAGRAGVPVPGVTGTGEILGTAAMVMDRLDGETIPRKLLRDKRFEAVRPRLAHDLGVILARLHTVSPGEVPDLPAGDPLDDLVEIYESLAEPRPSVEIALRWLRGNRPSPGGKTVVHGDFRTGNLLIGEDGVRGVLDWELTHAGDPCEDLGWLCVRAWRFGGPGAAGGFGSREELLAGYAAGGGTPPDEATLHWWEVYGTLRWTILCRVQAERYLSGGDESAELAVLGRRVCEQEHDLLLVLGLTTPEDVEDPLPAPDLAASAPPHDRPSAAALIASAGSFLAGLQVEDPAVRYQLRVAETALTIARRELHLAPAHAEAHRARLAALGLPDDAALAARIRAGDDDPRLVEAVRAVVRDRLLVANPRHLSRR
ncbi:phosphotransferase family protein [Amycolatopsis acidicola]|uniref:Phosphotransferase family protein n=1 Tax=Amycolatopsis acidicola TaxID=2596893 RepID=A0A5N0USM5_9PSEU|nr:phosphotransferase family protein [Amycolatopsis acidicola]KAA9152669.1 phosphotransferase family protein [Amycolatopsis acidicola]